MKKYIFSALVLATSLVACTDDYQDWANPQAVEQPAVTSFGSGSVSAVGLIDFATLAENQASVKVCSITAPTSSDAAYNQVSYKLVMGENATSWDIASDGAVPVAELKSYIESVYGKAPVEREMPATVEQWISNGTTTIKTGSASVAITAKLTAPEINPHFYVIGAPSAWDPTCSTLPFKHSEVNVYDDPVFTAMFPVENGDTWFAFADDKTVEMNDWSLVFAAREGNGKNLVGEKGSLCRRSELDAEAGDGSFMVSVNNDAKFIKVTVNLLDGWYLIEKVNFVDYIYLPGNAQGWNPGTASALKHEGDGLYTGFAYMDGDFKFTQERAWAAEYNNSSFSTCSADFSLGDGQGGNISFTGTPGVYYFEVNVVTGDLKATRVEKIGLIGDFNGWGTDFEMTWNAAELCYEAQNPGVTAAGWKFRMNGDWAINYGGALDNLTKDGSNIDAVGTTVKFYPTRSTKDNIYCTVE